MKKMKLFNSLKNQNSQKCYIPYIDSSGKALKEDEILFTNEENFQGRQTLESWDGNPENMQAWNVFSEGAELVYDDAGNFPVALMTDKGELMYLKISAVTGEVLPIHAGCCPSLDVIYTGPPQAGKTVHILQMSDPAFHDTLVRGTGCSFEDDLPSSAPARRRYEEAGARFKQHFLPAPTRRGEIILPYVYYVTSGQGSEKRHVLLRYQDIDGEECVDMPWNSKIFPYNYFFMTIGADELLAGERGEPVQYTRMVDKFLPRLRVLRRDRDFEIVVIVTKCDLLDQNDPLLTDAFENSIRMEGGRMVRTTHADGFDFKAFENRGECMRRYLQSECPNFYNKLVNAVPGQRITFSMIASIGSACDGESFEDYRPFCIDEPVLAILAKKGMYPISSHSSVHPQEERVDSLTGSGAGGFLKKLQSLLEM